MGSMELQPGKVDPALLVFGMGIRVQSNPPRSSGDPSTPGVRPADPNSHEDLGWGQPNPWRLWLEGAQRPRGAFFQLSGKKDGGGRRVGLLWAMTPAGKHRWQCSGGVFFSRPPAEDKGSTGSHQDRGWGTFLYLTWHGARGHVVATGTSMDTRGVSRGEHPRLVSACTPSPIPPGGMPTSNADTAWLVMLRLGWKRIFQPRMVERRQWRVEGLGDHHDLCPLRRN